MDYTSKLFWAVEIVVVNAADFRSTTNPPGSVQEQSPHGFHGRGCGNHTSLKVFKELI